MTARALVTGGAGFVGRHLISRLLEEGWRVRSLDLRSDDHLIQMQHESGGPFESVTGSVTDPVAAARAVDDVDTIFHLAGVADLWAPDQAVFDDVNMGGVACVLRAGEDAGVRRFLFCSSATTLVGKRTPIGPSYADETVEWAPEEMLGAYPASKRRAELLVQDAARRGVHTVIVNPTEPAGAGDDSVTPPTRMMLDFINGDTPAFIDCILNFVPVADLATGMIAAAAHGRPGERYILGGDNIEMRDLLSMLSRLSGRSMPGARLPYAVALAAGVVDTHLVARISGNPPKAPLTGVRLAGRRVAFDGSKATRDLGWRAGPAEPALRDMVAWARGNGLIRA